MTVRHQLITGVRYVLSLIIDVQILFSNIIKCFNNRFSMCLKCFKLKDEINLR